METSLISGATIGYGNSLIPLYINQYHWTVTLQFIEELISIGITQNPYLFKPTMYGIYAHVLLNLISDIVLNPTYMKIRLLIQLIITIDRLNINYNQSQDIRIYILDKFVSWLKQSDSFDKSIRFKIYEEIIRYNMKIEFKTKKDIYQMDVMEILNKSIDKQNIKEFENLCIFMDLIDPKQIIKIINCIELTFGNINDSELEIFKETIKNNKKIFNIQNIFISICPFECDIIIKCFTYQAFLTRTQKLKSRLIESYGIIDFTNTNLTQEILLKKINELEEILFQT